MDCEPLSPPENHPMSKAKKILLGLILLIAIGGWLACNNLEWRGGGIPKIVWNRSQPDIQGLKQERTLPPPTLQKDDTNSSTAGHGSQLPWTAFRGSDGKGIYAEQNILTNWPEEGPPLRWKKLIGGGHASFSVANQLAFTIEQQEENEVVIAVSTTTGTVKWSYEYPAKFKEYFGGIGPRTTPLWNEGLLYTLGAKGHLHCFDSNSGKLLWGKNLTEENKVKPPYWGVSASPTIFQDKLFITPGGNQDNAIVALDKKTGEKIWNTLNGDQTYSTPALLNLNNKLQLVVSVKNKIAGLDPESGRMLWSRPWKIFMNNYNIAQPTRLTDDVVLISAGYGTGAEAFNLIKEKDTLKAESLWKSKSLKTKFSSPVFWEGYLYGLNENRLVCLDAANGSLQWRGNKYGYGQIIAASGHLIIMGDDGDLSLVEMNPSEFKEKASFKALTGGRTWNYPALSKGMLFIRNSHEMACYDLRRK